MMMMMILMMTKIMMMMMMIMMMTKIMMMMMMMVVVVIMTMLMIMIFMIRYKNDPNFSCLSSALFLPVLSGLRSQQSRSAPQENESWFTSLLPKFG
jgi:hypothetical protein